MKKLLLSVILILAVCVPAAAEHLTVEGDMRSQIRFAIDKKVTTGPGVQKLVLSFVVPRTFQSPTYTQDIKGFDLTFSPAPQDERQWTDSRGNQVVTATWKSPPSTIDCRLAFNAVNETRLKLVDTSASYPLASIPGEIRYYLKATDQVQSEDSRIRELAGELVRDVNTEYDAVERILTFVVDSIHYVTPPARYDAIYSLESGRGNCQNFSHLSAALMRAAGIPVVIVDTDVPWPYRASFIGIDNRLGGRLAGEYVVRTIGGKGKVAVIRGVLGVATQEDRLTGFRDAIAGVPGIQCVAVQPANSERALGMNVMENILTSHPDVRAVFATNDQMALGAMEAIAARNLTGKVVLVGFDATREAVRAVLDGRLSAVMAQYPETIGKRSIEEAIKAARGQPVEKRIDVGTALVTRENAASFLR